MGYWWNDKLNELRKIYIKFRRKFVRAKRNNNAKKRWEEINVGTAIPLEEFLNGVNLIINSTYF